MTMTTVQHRCFSWGVQSVSMGISVQKKISSTKHLYAYGRIRGFLTAHARLSEGGKGPAVQEDLDRYCDFCHRAQTETSPCEHYQLFLAGWKEGVGQAEQVYGQMDLDLVEDIGRAAGFTSRRPPRNYPWVSAWHDGTEAKLRGEVFRRFIKGWLQTGVDRRRIKGV